MHMKGPPFTSTSHPHRPPPPLRRCTHPRRGCPGRPICPHPLRQSSDVTCGAATIISKGMCADGNCSPTRNSFFASTRKEKLMAPKVRTTRTVSDLSTFSAFTQTNRARCKHGGSVSKTHRGSPTTSVSPLTRRLTENRYNSCMLSDIFARLQSVWERRS